ncbi:MAG: hypothetical protein ACYS8Y_04535, partial [Planctomycetota bacterium]
MKRTAKLLSLFLVLGLILSLAVGCKKESPEEQRSKSETAGPKKNLKDIKIGISMYTLGAPYFAAQLNAAKKKAEQLGMKVAYTEARDDMVTQLANVEDL